MDGYIFLAAICSTWLILLFLGVGNRLHRSELRAGATPKGATPLIFSGCAVGLLLVMTYHLHPFLWAMMAILVGSIVAMGLAHFASLVARSLRREQRPKQPRQRG